MNAKSIFTGPELPWSVELSRQTRCWLILLFLVFIYVVTPLAYRAGFACGALVPLLIAIAAQLAIVYFFGDTRGNIAGKLGLRRLDRADWKAAILGVPAAFLVTASLNLVWLPLLKSFNFPIDGKQHLLEAAAQSGIGQLLLIIVSVSILTPIAEEISFRRMMYSLFWDMGKIPALLITAAIFAVAHLFLPGTLPLFGLGVVFQVLYLKQGNLAVSMISHGLFNLSAVLLQRFLA